VAPATTQPPTSAVTGNNGDEISAATIALIVAIVAAVALIVAVIVLLNRHRARDRWIGAARQAVAEGQRLISSVVHGLATLGQPTAAAHTWSDVEAQGAQLHRRLQGLSGRPPDEGAAAAAARADQTLQELRAAVDSDRALRLGPPPPTAEQLGYSEAVVRQRSSEFEQAVEDLDAMLRSER
jgi:hypothetical protein